MSAVRMLAAAMIKAGLDPVEVSKLIARYGAELRRPARRIHQKDLSGTCFIYFLVDPRDQKPFYIGISMSPWGRFDNHRHDPSSAAHRRLMDIIQTTGAKRGDILKIHKECRNRDEALDLEYRLINSTPGLVNKCRTRSKMFEYRQ
jgi:hypothetical protein